MMQVFKELKHMLPIGRYQGWIFISLLSGMNSVAAGLFSDGTSTDYQPSPAMSSDPTPASNRSVSGFIIRARPRGNSGSSGLGGPRCTDLTVTLYLQNVAATQGRFLAAVAAVDTNVVAFNGSTACAYSFSTTQAFASTSPFKRWFAVVNERGPIDYRTSCYQQAYSDLGSFAPNVNVLVDIGLTERCP